MAVSIEAAFVLLDKASRPLKDIEDQAKKTDKALRGMGQGGAMGDASKQISKTTQILDQHGNVLSTVEQKTKGVTAAAEKEAEALKKVGREGEKTLGFFKNVRNHIENFTRSMIKSHPAIQGFGQALGGALGGLKGFATALPMFGTLILSLLPQIVALSGAIVALGASLAGAVGGGALLGGGLLGSFAVGLGSVAVIAKPAIKQLGVYEKAVTNLNKAIASGKPGQIKAAQRQVDALAKANPGVAALARNIAGFKKEWDKATAPARASFFKIAADAIGTLRRNVGFLSREVNRNLAAVASAFHKYIGPLSNALKPLISGFGNIFRRNIGGTMQGVINVLRGLSNILKVIAPDLSKAGSGFAAFTDKFEKWTASPKGQKTIKNMTDAFKQWAKLLWEVARILGSLIGAGMKTGTGEIAKWANSLKKIADNLAKPGGTRDVVKWFKQSMDQTNKMLPVIKKLADSMAQLYQIFKPLSVVTGFVIKSLPAPLITALAGLVIGAKVLKGASSGVAGVGKAFGKFGGKGDRPTDPLWVAVSGTTGGSYGGGGGWSGRGMKAAEKEAEGGFLSKTRGRILDTRLGGKFGGTRLGARLLGSTAAGESEQVALNLAGAATRGGLVGKIGGVLGKVPLLGRMFATAGAGTAAEGVGATALESSLGSVGVGAVAPLALGLLSSSLLPASIQRSKGYGIVSGAASGAAMGGTIGSIIPGVGTLAGAGIGGALGGLQSAGLLQPAKIKGLAVAGFKGVKDAAGDAWKWIKGHWDWLGILAGPMGLAVTMVIKHFGAITRFIGSLPGKIGRLLSKVPGAVGKALSSVWNVFTFPFRKAWDWISGLPSKIGRALSAVAGWVGRAVSNVGSAILSPFRSAWNWVSSLPSRIGKIFSEIPGEITKGLKGLGNAIFAPFKAAFDLVKKHLPHIGFKSHKILGVSVDLPSIGLAGGGTVPYTTDVLVGEKGPEVVHLPKGTQVTPNWALPTHAAATGTPTPIGGAGPAMSTAGAQSFTRTLQTTQNAMTKLVHQSNQIMGALRAMISGLNAVENELSNPRSGLIGALNATEAEFNAFTKTAQQMTNAVSNQFQNLAASARKWMQQIQGDAQWLGDQLNKILPPESQTAFDAMVTNMTNTRQNLQKVWQDVIGDVSWGVTQIMKAMAGAFKTMGVNAPAGVAAAAKGKARGGRLPGPPRGDHIPLYSSGGNLLGVADGGELIVNRHTESRVNAMLGGRTTLGQEVAGETTPHAARWATGGRISTNWTVPGYQTGGVVGEVNSLASAAGFNKIAIAGLLGNAQQESSMNPNTPGGGLWQQISNFGSGTGGSVQAQWARMLPQIMGIRNSMNNAGSPGGAATIFEQSFERAGIPALANRIKYANLAYAGQLGGAITGGVAGAGGGVAAAIKGPTVKGPAGAITAIGQAAIDQIVKAANTAVAAAQPAVIGGGGGAPGPTFTPTGGPTPPKVQAALQFANELATRHPPYGHQGAGWGLGAYDCSSYVSTVMDAAGIWPKWVYYTAAQPINAHTDPGPGQYITIGTWGTSGQQAHTMMEINGQYFESGGGDGGPHRDSGWSQKFDQYRHPHGFALGGIVDASSAAKSKQNLFTRINPGVGKPGYQPTQEEAIGIQRNQQAISKRFAKGHALGGYLPVPWFGNGGDFIAKRPTIIGVGDRPGGERVQVSPAGGGRVGSPVHIEIHKVEVHRKGDIQKIVDEELAALANSLEAQI